MFPGFVNFLSRDACGGLGLPGIFICRTKHIYFVEPTRIKYPDSDFKPDPNGDFEFRRIAQNPPKMLKTFGGKKW